MEIEPQKTDMVIFRENSEDIYAGIEWQADTDEAKQVIDFLQKKIVSKKKKKSPGQFPDLSNQGMMHSAWKPWLHGSTFIGSLNSKSSRQITHVLFMQLGLTPPSFSSP